MYPDAFLEALDRLRRGDAGVLSAALSFLEADLWTFRSGYVRAEILRRLKRAELSDEHRRRLEDVIVRAVDGPETPREFRDYCRLARSLSTDRLRAELHARLASPDPVVRRHARWAIEAMESRGPRVQSGA